MPDESLTNTEGKAQGKQMHSYLNKLAATITTIYFALTMFHPVDTIIISIL